MQITFDDDEQTITLEGQAWWTKYAAVNTPEGLLKCVYYLSGKSNRITLADMRQLMTLCSKKFGYNIACFNAVPPQS